VELGSKEILITGAGGFIGSCLSESLIRKGYNIRVFVLYNAFESGGCFNYCLPDLKMPRSPDWVAVTTYQSLDYSLS